LQGRPFSQDARSSIEWKFDHFMRDIWQNPMQSMQVLKHGKIAYAQTSMQWANPRKPMRVETSFVLSFYLSRV